MTSRRLPDLVENRRRAASPIASSMKSALAGKPQRRRYLPAAVLASGEVNQPSTSAPLSDGLGVESAAGDIGSLCRFAVTAKW